MSASEHPEVSENQRGRDNLAPESGPTIDPLERLLELSSEMQTVWTEAARNSRRRRMFARLFRNE
ncbi:Uncharacterised protein [Mycobacteroides abscessus subsp. abscessus]|uniref:hypothetical protein n=1 Tax=Mycobacteroides abscessus TaxID=36809 RepID=UPI00092A8059|nr:hypothetical protein [Mycobacteroides abscessus]SII74951.1 Uncharacterised protein [Mycobacteroides abscessus subsp. abscessus]SIJ49067.1 Uncharacterised protein [Mycobacteroides abscessus subsp. abscessus]SIM00953.1 Uncharacterised protein [Mycobacteroides abscessus subsp. abscessus]SLL03951.1 Uncharacterised protein [Mycobacteroides abscessus subsp. abscessus]